MAEGRMLMMRMMVMLASLACSTMADLSITAGKAGVIATYGGSVQGNKPCYFPFKYKGEWYSECTMMNYNKAWCSTTANYDQDKQWGICQESQGHCYIFISLIQDLKVNAVYE